MKHLVYAIQNVLAVVLNTITKNVTSLDKVHQEQGIHLICQPF